MTQTSKENVAAQSKDDQAAHFTVHPGVKAIVIPLWMIDKIHIDLYTAPQELVVQLIEEGNIEGEKDEAS